MNIESPMNEFRDAHVIIVRRETPRRTASVICSLCRRAFEIDFYPDDPSQNLGEMLLFFHYNSDDPNAQCSAKTQNLLGAKAQYQDRSAPDEFWRIYPGQNRSERVIAREGAV